MPALSRTVRVDHAYKVVRLAIEDALSNDLAANRYVIGMPAGTVSIPRVEKPFVFFQPLTLPTYIRAFKDEHDVREAIETVDVAILTADVGREYKTRLNGLPAKYTAVGGDTVDDIRDALISQVNGLGEKASAAILGAGALRVTPTNPGDIYTLTSPTSVTRLTVTPNYAVPEVYKKYVIGRRRMTARLQFFSKPERAGSEGAHYLANLAYDALDTPDNRLYFRDNRISVRPINEPTNLSGIDPSDSENEQRASFDIEITLGAMSVHDAAVIKTVEVEITIGSDTIIFETP